MKKNLLASLLLLLAPMGLRAQSDNRLITIERKFDTAQMIWVDSLLFSEHYYYPRDYEKRIFINEIAIDSSRFYLEEIDFVIDEVIYGHNRKNSNEFNETFQSYEFEVQLYKIDLDRRTIKKNGLLKNVYLQPLSKFYRADISGNDSIIYKIDPKTLKMEAWLTVHPYFPKIEIYPSQQFRYLGSVYELNDTRLLMEFVDCTGDCVDYRYLIYNLESKEYQLIEWYEDLRQIEIAKNVLKGYPPTSIYAGLGYLAPTFDHDDSIRYSYGYFDTGDTTLIHDQDYIFNENFEIVTPALKKSRYGFDYNYNGNVRTSFMIGSQLDNGKTRFLAYKILLPLERSFYKIFNNETVLPADLEKLNKEDLSILKNFVFAKHNYGFTSEFYQAYFNLFDFYNSNEKRSHRIKDMAGLLTKVDQDNLTVIKNALKKYE